MEIDKDQITRWSEKGYGLDEIAAYLYITRKELKTFCRKHDILLGNGSYEIRSPIVSSQSRSEALTRFNREVEIFKRIVPIMSEVRFYSSEGDYINLGYLLDHETIIGEHVFVTCVSPQDMTTHTMYVLIPEYSVDGQWLSWSKIMLLWHKSIE